MKNIFRDYKKNQDGNFAIMFGITLSFLVGGIAVAIDISKAHSQRSKLNDIADAAALAGAYAATTDEDNREAVVLELINSQLASAGIENVVPVINFDDTNSELTVSLNGNIETVFGGIFGFSNLNTAGQSTTSFAQNDIIPISMAFVLDVSGSMNGDSSSGGRKIDELQRSVDTMFNVIQDTAQRTDILQTKMRTGMTAFDYGLADEHTVPMGFGWTTVENEVFRLSPGGDTNTTPAFDLALEMLTDDTPKADNLREFIIFMTDGENDDAPDNWNTILLCNQAKAQGIKVFSIAFEAPQIGQNLLRVCSSETNNGDISNQELIDQGLIDQSLIDDGLIDLDPIDQANIDQSNLNPTVSDSNNRQYYFDAQNANELQAAFRQIGEEIGQFETRIIR